MTAYYNENDPKAAAWLRELIARNLIAPGIVDDRSIADVRAGDLASFAQCHFFAGIGVWSYALRAAGWADNREVWTGSCPCQSFSAAGKGAAFDDPRHLWPVWFRLVRECRPDVVFGEQVSAAIRHDWLDLVSTDMEAEGYAIGSSVFGAHSVGAPHQRQRLWWVAQSEGEQLNRRGNARRGRREIADGSAVSVMELAEDERYQRYATRGWQTECRSELASVVGDAISAGLEGYGRLERQSVSPRWEGAERHGAETGGDVGVAHNWREGRQQVSADAEWRGVGSETPRLEQRFEHGGDGVRRLGYADSGAKATLGSLSRWTSTDSSGSFWSTADWLPCRDGKFRPVEPGTFPLAHGAPARVGRLRGYGNAIVSEAATAFIEAYREVSEGAA